MLISSGRGVSVCLSKAMKLHCILNLQIGLVARIDLRKIILQRQKPQIIRQNE